MAPDTSPNMTEQSDKATGFFSLPRELRDRIYDMVRKDSPTASKSTLFILNFVLPCQEIASSVASSKTYTMRDPQ